MGKVMVNETSLQDIASAIREKTKGTDTYKPSEMGEAIRTMKNGADPADAPKIDYDGKWSGWTLEIYDGVLYWEALFSTSGAMFNYAVERVCDAWGIGGGGAGGNYSNSYSGGMGTGAGSGYTNMVEGIIIPTGSIAVTIGAGGSSITWHNTNTSNAYISGASGGATTFLTLSCSGGGGGSPNESGRKSAGTGGSNGGASTNVANAGGGENGTPGGGKIMSKFWSVAHNTDYGAGGIAVGSSSSNKGGGGGGYMAVGHANSTHGQGYGGGGGGFESLSITNLVENFGNSGCLIIRIPVE